VPAAEAGLSGDPADRSSLRQDILANQAFIDELNARIRRKNEEIRIIQQISSEINATLDLERILDAILRASDEVLGFSHAMILLADDDGDSLTLSACRGYDDAPLGMKVGIGKGVIGVVARRRKMMRIGNLLTQKAYVQAVRARSGQGPAEEVVLPGLADAQSQLAIPLLVQGRLIGVFAVESAVANAFDELDEVLLSIVANQVANAIDNGRLHAAETVRSRELDAANTALSQLNETLESKVRERTAELSRALEAAGQEKDRSEALLKRLVPPDLVPLMLEGGLAPQRLTASVMFVDLEGFTAFTAGMDADEMFARLNQFFAWAGEVIKRHRGYLNKTTGDGLMALFGVPRPSPSHALDAVLAATFLQREIADILPQRIRIGVSSGPITTGLLGPADKAMYDVLGECVNVARRMEEICEPGAVTVAAATHEAVAAHFSIAPLGRQEVKGFEPVACFRVEKLRPLLEDGRRVDPSSRFARQHADCVATMARMRDETLAAVNFVTIQSRDGAMGHNGAVAAFALALLRFLRDGGGERAADYTELSEDELLQLALLHDIGKHAVDPGMLNANGIDARARQDLRDRLEAETLKAIDLLELNHLAEGLRQFYAFEARGGLLERVSPLVEIVAIADIYDALTAPKIYKGAAWRIGGALAEILRLPRYDRGENEIVRGFVELMRPENEAVSSRRRVSRILE